jgi:GAF domain-containing protein
MTLQSIIDDLLEQTGASRCTLRQDVPGSYAFPVTHEALAPGVASLKELGTIDQTTQPVVQQIQRDRRQVVQHDSSTAFPRNPEFERMRAAYGGLASQIVTPVVRDDAVVAIISLHHLGQPRVWTDAAADLCTTAASNIQALLDTASTRASG